MVTADEAPADFGARMKRRREQRGVTLRQIADQTKLSMSALEALERNDISRLPGGIFSRGFVRSYALEIGLDPERTVREFLTQFPAESENLGLVHAVAVEATGERSAHAAWRSVIVVVMVTALIAAIVVFALARR